MGNGDDTAPVVAEGGVTAASSQAHRRERAAIRNVTLLLVLRGAVVAGGVATAALVPRTMGPATYGRYDLVTMLTFWFSMLGGLGMGQVMSRQAPQLAAEGATEKLRSLFGNLLALRALSGVVVATLYFLVTRLWLSDLDWIVLLLLSVVVCMRVPTGLCYALFLGQGRIGRWAVPEVVRQWGSVVFALPCFLVGGFRGAVVGYLVSELVITTIAIAGARRWIDWRGLRFGVREVAPYLRVGLAFFAGDLVLSAIDRSGAVLVRSVTFDYAQVGMFSVSYQIFMAAVLSTLQIVSSFIPIITVLRAKREDAELKKWIERLAKWLAVLAVLGLLGSLLLGPEIVPLVLGRAYATVAPNLVVLAAAILLLPLVHVCSLLALTHDRPVLIVKAGLTKLACFWAVGVPLVTRWGSFGACLAVLVAMAAQAVYLVVGNREVMGPALRRWVLVVSTGLAFTPLALVRGGPALNVALYLLAAGGFLLALRSLGAISTRELQALYRALGMAKAGRNGEGAVP